MTRILPVLPFTTLLFCVAFTGQALAQSTTSRTVTTTTPVDPANPPSYIPPSGVTPQVQREVNRARRLVREVRENTDNIQSKGEFGAQLWLVQGNEFFDDWRKPGTPTIDPVTTVLRGQTISTVIIFYGTAPDTKGLCNVHYDVVVKRPNGSVYDRRDDLIGWQDLAPASERQLMLGRNFVTINIGPDDPAGIYSVEANVHDNVSRTDLALKQTFVVQ